MTTLDGEEWQDYPKPYLYLPSWNEGIQSLQKTTESYSGKTYNVTAVLYQSGGENVYLGTDTKYRNSNNLKRS
ncbi:hypothetical protein [Streptococcus thoraltensis]|uniref:hypothetical protein n=1 Tax=Streptococcus thoraltensis TaxID=55085 RepID=UPI000370356B|nr:hypothetical protein [Streptococcus thoraltensis]